MIEVKTKARHKTKIAFIRILEIRFLLFVFFLIQDDSSQKPKTNINCKFSYDFNLVSKLRFIDIKVLSVSFDV